MAEEPQGAQLRRRAARDDGEAVRQHRGLQFLGDSQLFMHGRVFLAKFARAIEDALFELFVQDAQLAFHVVFVKGHLHHRAQGALGKRLDDVAERLGDLGPFQRLLVGVSGDVDDGDVIALADFLGSLDAVAASLQHDVHENEVGLPGQYPLKGFLFR